MRRAYLVAGLCLASFAVGWMLKPDGGPARQEEPDTPLVARSPGAGTRGPLGPGDTGAGDARTWIPAGRPPGLGDGSSPVGPAVHLSGDDIEARIRRLRQTDDVAEATRLARELVRKGGSAGVDAVGRIARGDARGVEFQVLAAEALALAPSGVRAEAAAHLLHALQVGLPPEMEIPVAVSYAALEGRGAVPALVEALRTGMAHADTVFSVLPHLVGPYDVPMLLDLVSVVPGAEDQGQLIRVIGYAAGSERVSTVVGLLREPPKGWHREPIAQALSRFARPQDLPMLWEVLREEADVAVQGPVARAIARLGGRRALESIAALAADPGSGVLQSAVAHALEATASPETLPEMAEALTRMRTFGGAERLAHAIARSTGREGLTRLLDCVAAGGPEASRIAAVRAIERHGSPSDAERLEALFREETNPRVATDLVGAVLRLDPTRGTERILTRLAEFEEPLHRAAIAEVLEWRGGVGALPSLESALQDEEDRRVRWHMARAIAARGPPGTRLLGDLIDGEGDPARRLGLIRAAASVDASHAATLVRDVLRSDPDVDVRRAAAEVMGRSRDPSHSQQLERALATETSPTVRTAIEAALRSLDR